MTLIAHAAFILSAIFFGFGVLIFFTGAAETHCWMLICSAGIFILISAVFFGLSLLGLPDLIASCFEYLIGWAE